MKRREALKLLAAAPAIATTLKEAVEDESSMTPSPTPVPDQTAALVHSDLRPELIGKVTDALHAGGYGTKVITPTDPALLLDVLKGHEVVIMDEVICGRPALEFLMHMRARPDTQGIPVGLLCSDPSHFTVSAYFAAGVRRLINKNNPDEFARLADPYERPDAGAWARVTEPARQVIFLSQKEAGLRGESFVGTEHLLLGLLRLPDSGGAKILTRMGISLESVRDEILRQITREDRQVAQEMLLTPQAKTVVDQAYAEAWGHHDFYLDVEHLLIGMLKETEGLAGRALLKLGATLERARAELRGPRTA